VFQIKKILFPVDFSPSCLGAARYVEAFAGRFQAELTLLYVLDLSGYAAIATPSLWGVPAIEFPPEGAKWARERMNRFLAEELKHLDVKRKVVEGNPSLEIIAEAKRSGTDLIMMPTHGMSVFRRYLLGSVASKVLHDAECPVWTGAHMENAPPLEAISFPKILCAVDMGPQSEEALRWAGGFAAEHGAELIVAHVVPASEARPAKYFDARFVAEVSEQVQQDLQALLSKLGITARIVIAGGDPAKVVSGLVQSENASQLVIGRGAVTEGLGRLRTHAYAMIRSAPCPVVSV
jgi:nucleotide-binding universal stress UspA family protein